MASKEYEALQPTPHNALAVLKDKGVSLMKAAHYLGLSYQRAYAILNGYSKPSAAQEAKIEELMKMIEGL